MMVHILVHIHPMVHIHLHEICQAINIGYIIQDYGLIKADLFFVKSLLSNISNTFKSCKQSINNICKCKYTFWLKIELLSLMSLHKY